ncbi:GGDEF domain-containing protein [Rhodocyclaceae bacterium SMB388]
MDKADDAVTIGMNRQHPEPGVQVLDFLAQHALSASPIHYWVAHEYLQGNNPELAKTIDDCIASGKTFDTFFVRDLYERFIVAESFRQFRGMGEDMERLLGGLIDNLREADRSATGLKDSLSENITQLKRAEDPSNLKTIAQNLLKAAVAASVDNENLQKNLESTEQEARSLRSELEKHRRESITDPLTGLFNRRGMELEMARVFGLSPDGPAAMLVLDIDHFKKINDTYGHAIGDVVIRKVAETIRSVTPEDSVSVRFGGEEFIVLLSGASPELARSVGENVRQTIEKLRLIRRHDKLAISPFTISVGVAARTGNDTLDTLFDRADKALYEAKSSGRNRVISAP